MLQIAEKYIQGRDIFIGFRSLREYGFVIDLPECAIFKDRQWSRPFGQPYFLPLGSIVNMRIDMDANVLSVSLNGVQNVSFSYDPKLLTLPITPWFIYVSKKCYTF